MEEDVDFASLAARVAAGLDGVRACVVLSHDGLTLGAHPEGGEERGREVWEALSRLGEPDRGFLIMGEEMWAVVRRGPYTGVVVAAATAKPGLVLDRLDASLRSAEAVRARKAQAPPTRPDRTATSPRTQLHREPAPGSSGRLPGEEVVGVKRVVDVAKEAGETAPVAAANGDVPVEQDEPVEQSAQGDPPSPPKPTRRGEAPAGPGVVDPVALAREFAELLSESEEQEGP